MTSRVAQHRSQLREAHTLLSTDPPEARRQAERLVEELEDHPELLAEGLGLLARARHYCGDLEDARSAFESASSVAPIRLLRGHILCQWAFLDLDFHHYGDALHKVSRGLALIEAAEPSPRDLAQGLIARGAVCWHNGLYDQAAQDNRRALMLIHPKKDPGLYVTAMNNLGPALLFGSRQISQIREALALLDEASRILRRHRIPFRSTQNAFLLWTRGLAYRLMGADERAEKLLAQARKILLDLEAYALWVRVSLDLIEVYIHYRRWGLVKKTLAEGLAHAREPETVAVLKVFHDQVMADAVTDDIIAGVYARVHGKQRKPPIIAADDDELEPIGF